MDEQAVMKGRTTQRKHPVVPLTFSREISSSAENNTLGPIITA
jgi:hypothetical protein